MAKVTRKSKGLVIRFNPEPEFESPENCFDSGDVTVDKKMVAEIVRRALNGDPYAWFCAHVRVTYCDTLTADTYLGCCSYDSMRDFIDNSGYYNDMVDECIADINAQLSKLIEV